MLTGSGDEQIKATQKVYYYLEGCCQATNELLSSVILSKYMLYMCCHGNRLKFLQFTTVKHELKCDTLSSFRVIMSTAML